MIRLVYVVTANDVRGAPLLHLALREALKHSPKVVLLVVKDCVPVVSLLKLANKGSGRGVDTKLVAPNL